MDAGINPPSLPLLCRQKAPQTRGQAWGSAHQPPARAPLPRVVRVTFGQAAQPFPSSLCRSETTMREKKKGGMTNRVSLRFTNPSLLLATQPQPSVEAGRSWWSSTRCEWVTSTPPEAPGFIGFQTQTFLALAQSMGGSPGSSNDSI